MMQGTYCLSCKCKALWVAHDAHRQLQSNEALMCWPFQSQALLTRPANSTVDTMKPAKVFSCCYLNRDFETQGRRRDTRYFSGKHLLRQRDRRLRRLTLEKLRESGPHTSHRGAVSDFVSLKMEEQRRVTPGWFSSHYEGKHRA